MSFVIYYQNPLRGLDHFQPGLSTTLARGFLGLGRHRPNHRAVLGSLCRHAGHVQARPEIESLMGPMGGTAGQHGPSPLYSFPNPNFHQSPSSLFLLQLSNRHHPPLSVSRGLPAPWLPAFSRHGRRPPRVVDRATSGSPRLCTTTAAGLPHGLPSRRRLGRH